MKKLTLLILGFFTTIFCVNAQVKINYSKDSPLRKLQMAELYINALYVDSVDENKLVEDAIKGMIEKLDPHSSYSDAEEMKAITEPLMGNFEGIGIQFNMIDDSLVVIQPVVNGPSEKVGIMPGDRIITVNDTVIAGVKMPKHKIMKLLRGKKGSKVMLGIKRRNVKDVLTFKVTRDRIPIKSLEGAYMIDKGIGYIRLGNFGANTYKEFMEAMETLREHGMKDVIIDLQGNGGGFLQASVQIAGEFLNNNDLIVYTKGRAYERKNYKAKGNGDFREGRVVVLIDEFSASAAEIFTGAIQDYDRGIVVGRRSFGKGLVQHPITLPDNSMIRLTIAHYYTPSGRCIQKPYKKGDMKDYEMDFENRLKHGELTCKDSIHFNDSLKYFTLKEHRTVYGGGGIMPDYFVPLDTMKYSKYYRKLILKNIVLTNNLKYVDNNRKQLRSNYSSFDDFKKKYKVPEEIIENIIAEGRKDKIEPLDDNDLKQTKAQLRLQLKALVARDLWDMSEYYEIINQQNDIVNEAVKILKNK